MNPNVLRWKDLFLLAAREYIVPPAILAAVCDSESGGNPLAKSPAGAQGLMQLMDGTSRGLGVFDPFDPPDNIMGGAKYLREQYDRFGTWDLAFAAYNAGPGAVEQYGGIPPYEETQRYVRNVRAAVANYLDLDAEALLAPEHLLGLAPRSGSIAEALENQTGRADLLAARIKRFKEENDDVE